ncbi:MAG: alpha-hydroxy-acid oxidizing protein [Spongiibacteraceae bacterium]|jgi:(S)-mandelate dehydrogenase|nr:alpha-hydroxy-acid oxidizing protein [Spongiibacteraceae bacterium]
MTTSTQRYRGRDLSRALTIDDLRCMAQRALPRFLFEYIDGGAEDGISQRRNREAFEPLMGVPNTVTTVQARNQSSLLLGAKTALPLVVAPTGFKGLSRHRADVALAKAAAHWPYSSRKSTAAWRCWAGRISTR